MRVEYNQSANNPAGVNYANKWKFNGKELDDATGMYYYGARYYDPRISIFVSLDPLAEQTMEPYLYVGNNPVNLIDPTGMSSEGWYENNQGEIKYDKRINNQGDLKKHNIEGEFIANSFVGIDKNNNNYEFKENGKVSLLEKDAKIKEGTKVIGVEKNVTVLNSKRVYDSSKAELAAAIAVTQNDGPQIGFADVIAVGLLYKALTGFFTNIEEEQTIKIDFAKSKPGKAGDVRGAEHKTNARKSTENKHQEGQTRKQQVHRDKKRQIGWKRNK